MNQLHLEAGAQLSQERKALSLLAKSLGDNKEKGDGYSNSLSCLKLASMWLGKAKGALGIKSPYPESFNYNSGVIEPKTDAADDVELELPKDLDNVGRIKFYRNELNKLENSIANDLKIMVEHRSYQFAISNALTYCCEATLWLGDVLNDIYQSGDYEAKQKKEQEKKKEEGKKKEPRKVTSVLPTEFPPHDPKAPVGQIPVPSDYVNGETARIASAPIQPVQTIENQSPAPTADNSPQKKSITSTTDGKKATVSPTETGLPAENEEAASKEPIVSSKTAGGPSPASGGQGTFVSSRPGPVKAPVTPTPAPTKKA